MGRAPTAGAQTLSSQLSSYFNEKFVDFKVSHTSNGLRVLLIDIPKKLWEGIIGPELVRFADEKGLRVSVYIDKNHSNKCLDLQVFINDWEPAHFATLGWLMNTVENGIHYYLMPGLSK